MPALLPLRDDKKYRLRLRLVLQKLVATPLLALRVDAAIKGIFNNRKIKEGEVGEHLGRGRMHAHLLLIAHCCHCRTKFCSLFASALLDSIESSGRNKPELPV
jgi:hypothetical protein